MPAAVRKIASILLLAILGFNWVGYQFFTNYIQQRADTKFTTALDENRFDESQLISIKAPARYLSGYVYSNQFERIDGQVEIEGIQYNYVKRRIVNDSLEFLCIPNQKATQLQTAKNDFFRLVNDLQHPGQGKKADQHNAGKNILPDFISGQEMFSFAGISPAKPVFSANYSISIPACSLSFVGQPPETTRA